MVEKFCGYCQERTPHKRNIYNVWECTNCEPLFSESEESDGYDFDEPIYRPPSYVK